MIALYKSNENQKCEKWVRKVIKESYLTNKSSNNRIVKKSCKFTILTKDESTRNNILDKLILTIYRWRNSW